MTSSYTDEQLQYIEYTEKKDTKLIACAGSGKTRCVIARIENLIKNGIYQNDQILMLTFSRFTRDDQINRMKQYDAHSLPIDSIKTIDSFARSVIDTEQSVDVSLLSYRLMRYLEETESEILASNNILKNIRCIFVDEAQDLNEIQYRVFVALITRLKYQVNMVGDPNQNIYQFRKSSERYLTQFEGVVFRLTKNFRSHQSVVSFSKYLRPSAQYDIVCTKGENGCKPIMMFYEDDLILEGYIVDIINSAKANGIDLSEIAILSPTRGKMREMGRSHGLCFVSNLLYRAKIPFKQFYEESTEYVNEEGIRYEPEKGLINVMTYMGSKGLEWKYVIILDADMCLINKRQFDTLKHSHDQYLLYVACSRAIDNMYIFSKCYFKDGRPHFRTNPWFKHIPKKFYEIDTRFTAYFKFDSLKFIDMMNKDNRLSRIIDDLEYSELDQLTELIGWGDRKVVSEKKFYTNNYVQLEKTSSVFFSRYVDQLFKAMLCIRSNKPLKVFHEIEHIIGSKKMILDAPYEVKEWYEVVRKKMTWKLFDSEPIDPMISEFVNRNFDRNNKFSQHIIASNNYYSKFITDNRKWITDNYRKYIKTKDIRKLRNVLFNILVIQYSIDTQHYFHIINRGKKYKKILSTFSNMFDEMEKYVTDGCLMIDGYEYMLSTDTTWSHIDIIDQNDQLWDITCSSEQSIKSIIRNIYQYVRYNHLDSNVDTNIIIPINQVNLLRGIEYRTELKIKKHNLNIIMQILTK